VTYLCMECLCEFDVPWVTYTELDWLGHTPIECCPHCLSDDFTLIAEFDDLSRIAERNIKRLSEVN
jgi:hypothetical protein